MSEDPKGRLGRRLRRILLMLPYAIKHPGVSTDELARKFGVPRKDLVDDLNLLFLCGLPGYGPGDLIDVSLEGNRVYVRMADYFAAPLRLTPAEALALYAGGQAIAGLPGMEEADALRRALSKLGRALGTGTRGDGAAGIDVKLEAAPSEHLEALQRALRERRQVHLEYFSASRAELTERVVEPWGLITAIGRWYLVAWDHLSEDERMFRVDRIKRATVIDEHAEVPDDFEPQRYKRAFAGRDDARKMTMEISPAAARWFSDYYPVESSEELDDGWHRVELVASGQAWAATLLLRLGAEVRAVRPDSVRQRARELAARIAARYGS